MPASLTPWTSSNDTEPKEVEKSPNGRYIRYNILLGKGACKRVYKALDTEEGLEVAWNQVDLLGMDRDEEARQHLQEEIRVLQQLKHKNIMTFYAWWYDKSNGHINFITELFTAGNLRQYRKKLKIMSENVLKRWSHQILEGLLYLHGHTPPIVHRDLKCDNIFVNSATGEVKIGDLGLATVQQTAMSVVGTPEFMAPEVYDESYDERCDIYSFGMCLLELATLEYPYAECHSVPQIFKKVTLGIPPASLARVTPDLREFISLCIAHNPADRPSARELLKHPYLEAVRQHLLLGGLSSCGLPGSDSYSALPSGGLSVGSSAGLATMSTGGGGGAGGGPGSGWSTPSGTTLHCAASVRDLREALHQQEALARHLHQQHQNLQHQLQHLHGLHHSCPDPHAIATTTTTAVAADSSSCGGGEAVLRNNTGLMITPPPPLTMAGPQQPLVRSTSSAAAVAGQISSPGCRGAAAPPDSPASTPAAAAGPLPPLSGAPSLVSLVSSPREGSPLEAAAAASGGAAAVNTGGGGVPRGPSFCSMDSSVTSVDSDTDSDEEVLVPIELLKAGLLDEGFVDPDAAAFASDVSETSSDPSAISLVDPAILAGGGLLRPPATDPAQQPPLLHSQTHPPRHHHHHQQQPLPYRPSRLQPRPEQDPQGGQQEEQQLQQRQRKQRRGRLQLPGGLARRRAGSRTLGAGGAAGGCETISEGEGCAGEGEGKGDAAAGQGRPEQGEGEDEAGEMEEEGEEEEGGEEEAEGEGEGEEEEEEEEGGGASGPSVDLDPWAQRWALQGSLEAAMGLARGSGAGGAAAAAADGGAPSLACSVASSASSTCRMIAPAGGTGGVHSRQGSTDVVTFNPTAPPGASGSNTPALRMSFSGGSEPSPPPPLQLQPAAPPAAPPAALQPLPTLPPPTEQLASYASAELPLTAAAEAAAVPSTPLAMQASTPTLGASPPPVPRVVRLPSFRNKVLLTMQASQAAGGVGSPPPVPYFRSTSARLCSGGGGDGAGGSRNRGVPGFSSPSAPAGGPSSWSASSPAYRRASAADVDAAAPAAADACAGSPQPFAALAVAAAAATARRGEDGPTAAQSMPLPRLAVLPEGGSENGVSQPLTPTPMAAGAEAVEAEAGLVNRTEGAGRRRSRYGPGPAAEPTAEGTDSGAASASPSVDGWLGDLADAAAAAAAQLTAAVAALGAGGGAAATASAEVGRASAYGGGGGHLADAMPPAAAAAAGDDEDLTVIREVSRPIQGVIMRLKQWKRLVKDRAKGRRG